MHNPLLDTVIKHEGNTVTFDFTRAAFEVTQDFYRQVEALCAEDFNRLAIANGYTKLEPGECVVSVDDVKECRNLVEERHGELMAQQSSREKASSELRTMTELYHSLTATIESVKKEVE